MNQGLPRNRALTPIFEKLFAGVAALFLAAMVLLTVADVLLRSFFATPIQGMLELIELGLACTIFIALPAVFLRREHLVVDVIDHLAKPGLVRWLRRLGDVASLGVLAVIAWQMWPLAQVMYDFGDVTANLSIPRTYYWVPVLGGVVCSAVAALALLFRK